MWQFNPDAAPFILDAEDYREEHAAAAPRPIGSEFQSLWADELEDEVSPDLAPKSSERHVHWVDEEDSNEAPPDLAPKSRAPSTDETVDLVEQGVRRVRDRLSRNRREMRAANVRIAALESANAIKTVLIATLRATVDARDARIEALEKQATTFGAWFNGAEF